LFSANLLSDGPGDSGGAGEIGFIFGDVEVSFVEGERFDQVGVAEEDIADTARDGAVTREVGCDEDGIGAETLGGYSGHCGANSEFAGFVGSGAHNGALAAPGDNDGLAA